MMLKRVNSCCTGELYVVDGKKMGAAPKHVALILQYVLDLVSVDKFTCFSLQLTPPKNKKKSGESTLKSQE
eukprot:5962739-Amphidinium_carterae.1